MRGLNTSLSHLHEWLIFMASTYLRALFIIAKGYNLWRTPGGLI